jgi:hypothetical protein
MTTSLLIITIILKKFTTLFYSSFLTMTAWMKAPSKSMAQCWRAHLENALTHCTGITSVLHKLFLTELLNVSFDFFLLMASADNNFLHTPMNIQFPHLLIHNGTLVCSQWSHPVFIPFFWSTDASSCKSQQNPRRYFRLV